ncbi:MAG: FAD-dependent oxidoreductase [Terriglobales bacterium]
MRVHGDSKPAKRRTGGLPRRSFLQLGAAWLASAPLLRLGAQGKRVKMHVAVVGAGAFGGWTALHLLRRGARVTLLDAWGPGHSRASSGGETRIIRAIYGPDRIYVRMVVRSLQLWRENAERWGRALFRKTGVLWMAGPDGRYEQAALPLLKEEGIAFEQLEAKEAARRYPQINFEGVSWAIQEKDAGYLTARVACAAVLDGFMAEGGEYRQLAVEPGAFQGGALSGIKLSNGSLLEADRYVFACGPWLGRLFPGVLGDLIQPSRQEVFFFGTPSGDARFSEESLPAWIDNGTRIFYGIPGNQGRGFKIADDSHGESFDPTSGERTPSAAALDSARAYLRFRFPALKDAPLVEARVCQYENSPDGHYILDRLPTATNVWVVGGGSGHGFKNGPAIGEMTAAMVLEEKAPEPKFALARFASQAAGGARQFRSQRQSPGSAAIGRADS